MADSTTVHRKHRKKYCPGCPQCNDRTKTPSDLKVHMKSCYSKQSIYSPKRNKIMRVFNEDISIVTVDKDLGHDTATNSNTDNLKHNSTDKDISSPNFLFLLFYMEFRVCCI